MRREYSHDGERWIEGVPYQRRDGLPVLRQRWTVWAPGVDGGDDAFIFHGRPRDRRIDWTIDLCEAMSWAHLEGPRAVIDDACDVAERHDLLLALTRGEQMAADEAARAKKAAKKAAKLARANAASRAAWLASQGLTEETYAQKIEQQAEEWDRGFDERCRLAKEREESAAREDAACEAALCPECRGETLLVRGTTAPWLKYRVCSRSSEPGHLDEEAITARIEQMCAETEAAGYAADWPDHRDSQPGLRELPSVLMGSAGGA